MTLFDPLFHYSHKIGYEPELIEKIVTGEKYTAVLLKNGNIGVCANLTTEFEVKSAIPTQINISSSTHRIIYTSYLNALLNYENTYNQKLDIFQAIDFKDYETITMIGYFIPLVKKFDNIGIDLNIFDNAMEDERLLPEEKKEEYVRTADCLIVSGTTIQNGTFSHLLSQTKEKCDIFLLGPSSIMNEDMFSNTTIKVIFGAIFEKNDESVLELIKEGHGTRDFIKFGQKVVFVK